jgi:HSP20 family molecular chaperone IbpA
MNAFFNKILETAFQPLQGYEGYHELQSSIGSMVAGVSWRPPLDIVETASSVIVYVEVGRSEDIEVNVFNNKFTIKGKKPKPYQTTTPVKSEIYYGDFERTVILPISITSKENISLDVENGVLTAIIDKEKELQNSFTMRVQNRE